jgi:hyperosmotically inducible protein
MVSRILVAAVAALTLSVPALAANPDNLQIFRNVQKQVLEYPHFTIFDTVNAQIDNGVVTLTGKVTMPYKRDAIEKRVKRVSGIQAVNNRIDVLPVSQFDDDLRLQIANAIYSNWAFRPYAAIANPPIHVIVENGHVTLDGVVNSAVDKAIARSIAGSFNAFSVKNQLKTEAEVKEELEKL